MRRRFWPPPFWVIVLLAGCSWLIWSDCLRVQRVEFVSRQPFWSVDEPAADPQSATGYLRGMRRLIVPEHNNEAKLWVMQTQAMLATGDWRIPRVESENAPRGRELTSPLLFRFWFGLVAWCDHALSARSLGLATEHVALLVGPILHLLLLVSATLLTVSQFGRLAATLLCVGLVTIFPLADGFLPGVPNHRDLADGLILWSLLLLLTGLKKSLFPPAGTVTRSPVGWFFTAGVLGGLGLWVDLTIQLPVLCGLALGGLAAVLFLPKQPKNSVLVAGVDGWRWWALGGALACLAAWWVDNSAGRTGMHLRVTPMHGIAWIALAELLVRSWAVRTCAGGVRSRTQWIMIFLTAGILVTLAIWLQKSGSGFWAEDVRATQLSNSLAGIGVESFPRMFLTKGMVWTGAAVGVPLILVALAVWRLCVGVEHLAWRILPGLLLGPVAVGLGCSLIQIRWWHSLDLCILALVVATVGVCGVRLPERGFRRIFSIGVVLVAILGLVPVLTTAAASRSAELTHSEATAVIERDLAVWLARHAGRDAIVLATPNLTDSLCFYGGLRGLGTLSPENKEGLNGAIRIMAATTVEEAQELLQQRGVVQLAFVSWDSFFEDYAEAASRTPQATFIAGLRRWDLPTWLRPVPYYFPPVDGFEKTSVTVFTVSDEQRDVVALARIGEYFLETGQADAAAVLLRTLRRFPGDLNAQVALAQMYEAQGDAAEFSAVFGTLLSGCTAGADRRLAWDRRVSLAIVLAQGKRLDLAAVQLKACLREADAERIRALSVSTLRRFLILCTATHCDWPDRELYREAIDLIPPAMRLSLPP